MATGTVNSPKLLHLLLTFQIKKRNNTKSIFFSPISQALSLLNFNFDLKNFLSVQDMGIHAITYSTYIYRSIRGHEGWRTFVPQNFVPHSFVLQTFDPQMTFIPKRTFIPQILVKQVSVLQQLCQKLSWLKSLLKTNVMGSNVSTS